ncbi:MAG: patatin-like phospholipase family protein, partial [Burkholderiaceae bacterium]
FTDHLVPGWFDKSLRWRRGMAGTGWLDRVILVSPSPAFVASLPRAKLPDRKDFAHYGLDHARRIADWKRAIGDSARLRDALAAFVASPDLAAVRPL